MFNVYSGTNVLVRLPVNTSSIFEFYKFRLDTSKYHFIMDIKDIKDGNIALCHEHDSTDTVLSIKVRKSSKLVRIPKDPDVDLNHRRLPQVVNHEELAVVDFLDPVSWSHQPIKLWVGKDPEKFANTVDGMDILFISGVNSDEIVKAIGKSLAQVASEVFKVDSDIYKITTSELFRSSIVGAPDDIHIRLALEDVHYKNVDFIYIDDGNLVVSSKKPTGKIYAILRHTLIFIVPDGLTLLDNLNPSIVTHLECQAVANLVEDHFEEYANLSMTTETILSEAISALVETEYVLIGNGIYSTEDWYLDDVLADPLVKKLLSPAIQTLVDIYLEEV